MGRFTTPLPSVPPEHATWLRTGNDFAFDITVPTFSATLGNYMLTVWDNFTGRGAAPYLFLVGVNGIHDAGKPVQLTLVFREAFEVPSPTGADWRDAYRYVGNPLA